MNIRWLFFAAVVLNPSSAWAQDLERSPPDCASLPQAQAGASKGDARSIYLLARHYSTGKCIAGDGARAVELYEKAAQLNYAPACYNVGIISAAHQDFPAAEAAFLHGVELGHRGCELQLGILYSLAPPPVGDHAKAVAWLKLTSSRKEPVSDEAEDVLSRIRHRIEPAAWKSGLKQAEALEEKYGAIPEFKP